MSTLDAIRIAQRDAGEAAVIANLVRLGLVPKTATPLELMTVQRDELLGALKDAYPYIDNNALRVRIGNAIAKAEGITP